MQISTDIFSLGIVQVLASLLLLVCCPSLNLIIGIEYLDGINRRVPFREIAFG